MKFDKSVTAEDFEKIIEEEILLVMGQGIKIASSKCFTLAYKLAEQQYEQKTKNIRIGEIFEIDGKKYVGSLPKTDNARKMADGHGHIVSALHDL